MLDRVACRVFAIVERDVRFFLDNDEKSVTTRAEERFSRPIQQSIPRRQKATPFDSFVSYWRQAPSDRGHRRGWIDSTEREPAATR